jgi:sortase (surface protein transpeptidase)
VRAGGSNAVTNAGHSWHWTGTGYLGQDAHVAAFAHRTTAGGPYRNVHWLEGGDQFTLSTGDGRVYTYQVVDRFLTDFRTQNILDATRFIPGTTFSLIACTEPNFLPTSTAWRIVVTGVLLGWHSTG